MLKFHRIKFFTRIIFLLLLITIVFYLYLSKSYTSKYSKDVSSLENINQHTDFLKTKRPINLKTISSNQSVRYHNADAEVIKVAVVLCGDRLRQTIVTLKSVVILSRSFLHFIIFADEENEKNIKNKLYEWPQNVRNQLSFEIHPISFPNGSDSNVWKKMFKLCACQRLFLPSLLQHIDSLIYIDIDVLFMHPIEDLWKYFYRMNSSQIAALAPENEDFTTGWYNRFARHPFYEPLGVNSGVMLMNLTRMRDFKWGTYLQPILREYELKLTWGDQDIINIIFHFHSEKLYIFPCEWNYRPDHCMYSSVCKTAEINGVKVLHGSRDVYHNNKQPAFKAIYQVMENFQIGSDMQKELLQPMKEAISNTMDNNCKSVYKILIKSLEDFVFKNNTAIS